MGTSRTCGPRCHNASGAACDCWCRGLFHGAAGKAAREAFAAAAGELPAEEGQGTLFWRAAMAAARAAPRGAP